LLPDGSIKTTRKFHTIGPSRGENAILKKQADYVDNPKVKLATPTREKYRTRLDNHILPRWKDMRLGEFHTKEILDWLQHECSSWHMMIDLRSIMSGIARA
jgi:hypothetical protein